MSKPIIIAVVAGATAVAVGIGAAAASSAGSSWESEVRAGVAEAMAEDPSATDDMCSGLEMLDITTAEEVVAMMEDFGVDLESEDALSELLGTSEDLPSLPSGVSVRDVVLVAADEMVAAC